MIATARTSKITKYHQKKRMNEELFEIQNVIKTKYYTLTAAFSKTTADKFYFLVNMEKQQIEYEFFTIEEAVAYLQLFTMHKQRTDAKRA